MTEIKFGTDGWRATREDFTEENVARIALACAEYIGKSDTPVPVSFDNRLDSDKFALIAAKMLESCGIPAVITENSVPTPVLSYMVREFKSPLGIMITASHNPANWNGFKIKGPYAGSADPKITAKVQSLIDYKKTIQIPNICIKTFDPKPGYFKVLSKFIDIDLISSAKLELLINPMHGSGIGYLSEFLKGKANIREINNNIDHEFGGINPEPIDKNLKGFMSECKKSGISGISLDGDSDRLSGMGTDGVWINTHQIFAMLLKHLVMNKKWTGTVVKTFNLSDMISIMADKYSLPLKVTPIGFKYICDLMLSSDVLMGGEESGGMGFKYHIPERDAILASLLLIEAMAISKKSLNGMLGDIFEEFGRLYYDRVDLHLTDDQKQSVKTKLKGISEFAGRKIADIQTLDGTKLVFDNGDWIMFRASGTEPILRIYCEASDPQMVKEMLKNATSFAS